MSHYANTKYKPGDPITNQLIQTIIQTINLNKHQRGENTQYTPDSYLLTSQINKLVFISCTLIDTGLHEVDEKYWEPTLADALGDRDIPTGTIEVLTRVLTEEPE